MTGYTVHTGTSTKFASGWDRVFSAQPKVKGSGKAGNTSAAPKKKTKKKTKKKKS